MYPPGWSGFPTVSAYDPSLNARSVGGAAVCFTRRKRALVANAYGWPIRFNSRRSWIRAFDVPGKTATAPRSRIVAIVWVARYRTTISPKGCTGRPSTGCANKRRYRRRGRLACCSRFKPRCTGSLTGCKAGGSRIGRNHYISVC